MQICEKFALWCAIRCIVQSDRKEARAQMIEETILVQKLQIGKK